MSGRMKPEWCTAVFWGIVLVLLVMLPACADFKKDFLCRPDGHCVNASPGHTGIGI